MKRECIIHPRGSVLLASKNGHYTVQIYGCIHREIDERKCIYAGFGLVQCVYANINICEHCVCLRIKDKLASERAFGKISL
jgi:hypothetical protein